MMARYEVEAPCEELPAERGSRLATGRELVLLTLTDCEDVI